MPLDEKSKKELADKIKEQILKSLEKSKLPEGLQKQDSGKIDLGKLDMKYEREKMRARAAAEAKQEKIIDNLTAKDRKAYREKYVASEKMNLEAEQQRSMEEQKLREYQKQIQSKVQTQIKKISEKTGKIVKQRVKKMANTRALARKIAAKRIAAKKAKQAIKKAGEKQAARMAAAAIFGTIGWEGILIIVIIVAVIALIANK